jgi:hypothetical protein
MKPTDIFHKLPIPTNHKYFISGAVLTAAFYTGLISFLFSWGFTVRQAGSFVDAKDMNKDYILREEVPQNWVLKSQVERDWVPKSRYVEDLKAAQQTKE